MPVERKQTILKEGMLLWSEILDRTVQLDCYVPDELPSAGEVRLLLINDGQDLARMGFSGILADLNERGVLSPLVCVGIHAGAQRKLEYGTAARSNYQGWGTKADEYTRFIFEELLPQVRRRYGSPGFREMAFAGFSLGALSAMDIVWHRPQQFSCAGLFSGSFWWRSRDKDDPGFNEATDRIMHAAVRGGAYYPGLRFFFECGTKDEEEDRNRNGVIDSIDDTLDLIGELAAKGYDVRRDIRYLEIAGGRHDVETWGRAMPEFLLWAFGK